MALDAQELIEVELAVAIEVGLCEELPHAGDYAALAHLVRVRARVRVRVRVRVR